MGLVEIKSLQELIKFLPLLVKLHSSLDVIRELNGGVDDFIAQLTNNFQKDSHYYGLMNDGELYYFIAILRSSEEKACFWLLYVNKNKQDNTKNLLATLRSELRAKGIRKLDLITTNLTSSYERWLSKFGAKKHALTYLLEI